VAQPDSLYDDVRQRLAVASERVEELDASDEVKAALRERLRALANAARSDLTRTSRRVDDLLDELRAPAAPAAPAPD
jgi:hypothetical protein